MSMALILLDSLIAGIEMKSEIPVQRSELLALKKIIEAEQKTQMNIKGTVTGRMTTSATQSEEPPVRAVPMNLFPTSGSLQEAVDYAKSKLPITNENDLMAVLMNYHNTLLAESSKPCTS